MSARAIVERLSEAVENDLLYLAKAIDLTDEEKAEEAARAGAHLLPRWLERREDAPANLGDVEDDPDSAIETLAEAHPKLLQEFGRYALDWLLAHDPTEAPPSALMDFKGYVHNDWLIHFSDEAGAIWHSGFKYGVNPSDHHRVALSTYWKDTVRKRSPGLNFAYEADHATRYVGNNTGRNQKYGRDAVMFRANGLKVYHQGDQENQVIFLGRTAHDAAHIYIGASDGKWHVGETRGGRPLFSADGLEDAIQWVQANYDRYRKPLRPERERGASSKTAPSRTVSPRAA